MIKFLYRHGNIIFGAFIVFYIYVVVFGIMYEFHGEMKRAEKLDEYLVIHSQNTFEVDLSNPEAVIKT